MKKIIFNSLSVVIILFLADTAKADNFGINPSSIADTVYFNSTAKIEFIQGMTNDLAGSFSFNPANTKKSVNGALRVDLRTLKTGIDTRDRHMRERNLKTDKFPFAYFELNSVTNLPEKIQTDTTYIISGDGWFYIHGLKRQLIPELEISMSEAPDGNRIINVRAKFEIRLDDYQINRPKALFLKLAEVIQVEVIFSASNDLAKSVELPAWPEAN